ncbi:MAG: hypothetical protein IRZ11_03540 [Clostridia bacterium]|nr:hypothetical protein [Clostridia bacterium]
MPTGSGPELRSDEHVPIAEVCRRLVLSPASVRAFLAAFPEIGRITTKDGREGLDAEAFSRLRLAAAARGAGADDDRIRRMLAGREAAPQEVAATGAGPADAQRARAADARADEAGVREGADAADIEARVAERLRRIEEALSKSEARRAADQDRLLLALLKAQEEIQNLRYELGAQSSRTRKRRSFWARLLGI